MEHPYSSSASSPTFVSAVAVPTSTDKPAVKRKRSRQEREVADLQSANVDRVSTRHNFAPIKGLTSGALFENEFFDEAQVSKLHVLDSPRRSRKKSKLTCEPPQPNTVTWRMDHKVGDILSVLTSVGPVTIGDAVEYGTVGASGDDVPVTSGEDINETPAEALLVTQIVNQQIFGTTRTMLHGWQLCRVAEDGHTRLRVSNVRYEITAMQVASVLRVSRDTRVTRGLNNVYEVDGSIVMETAVGGKTERRLYGGVSNLHNILQGNSTWVSTAETVVALAACLRRKVRSHLRSRRTTTRGVKKAKVVGVCQSLARALLDGTDCLWVDSTPRASSHEWNVQLDDALSLGKVLRSRRVDAEHVWAFRGDHKWVVSFPVSMFYRPSQQLLTLSFLTSQLEDGANVGGEWHSDSDGASGEERERVSV